MKKLFTLLVFGLFISSSSICYADTTYYVNTTDYKPTLLDMIEDSTQDMAETIGEKTSEMADKTGKALKTGAKKAGHATKKGAKKATNWSARKIRNGAEKLIIKTEDSENAQNSESTDNAK